MSGSRSRKDPRNRGLIADLINLDAKNENCPLKPDAAVKKNGGLFLSLHGVKVEIPPGASTGRRERVVCAAFPSTARAGVAPWLGPYMRMASEMHMLYSPVSFKMPVAVFIPFSFAAAREMSCPNESIPAPVERMKRSESKDSSLDGSRSIKISPRPKGKAPYTMHFGDHRPKVPNLIDARSVSLLQCRIGSDNWKVVDKFTIVQPTVQHTKWPSEARKLMSQSSRWAENNPLTSAPSPPLKESSQPIGKKGNTSGKNKRSQNQLTKDSEPYDFMNKIENYCGGVFIHTEELNHCYVLVNANKAEGFWINRDGGLFLSPSLNPFLSVRVPKRVCPTQERAIFKTIEIRSNCLNLAYQFDGLLNEIEGCSDIYDLQLQDIMLKRPATIRLPLPQWYIDRRNKPTESLEQGSANDINMVSNAPVQYPTASEMTVPIQDKGLVILFQHSGHLKQIVWQTANVEELKEEMTRRKSRIRASRKDNLNSSRCRVDSIFIRLGWPNLLVGIRGGPWQAVKQPVYYTKKTICFDATVLGRFVLIGARDSERTASSKLAHLMTRIESLACAPPGALLICLQLAPNNWRIMANVYPEEQLTQAIQRQIQAGFIPLVQFGPGVVRKALGLNNAVIQALEHNYSAETGAPKERRYRLTGHDINHVLMFNGLCLELRFQGDIQIKSVSQFETYTNCIRTKDKEFKMVNSPPLGLLASDKGHRYSFSETNLDLQFNLQPRSSLFTFEKKEDKITQTTLLSKHARIQLHELLSDTSCIVEIEPVLSTEEKYSERSTIKAQYLSDLLKKPTPQVHGQNDESESESDSEDDEYDEDLISTRRFSNYAERTPTSDDGKEPEESFTDGKPKDRSYSPTHLNEDLFSRLESMIENGKIIRSSEFITKIHELYHVGTIEVWLIPPDNMSQVESKEDDEDKDTEDVNLEILNLKMPNYIPNLKYAGYGENTFQITGYPTPPTSPYNPVTPRLSQIHEVKINLESNLPENQDSHNIIRLNTVAGMETARGKPPTGVIMSDFPSNPEAPLATYNVMIDPDIFITYLKALTSKPKRLMTTESTGERFNKMSRSSSFATRRKSAKAFRSDDPSPPRRPT